LFNKKMEKEACRMLCLPRGSLEMAHTRPEEYIAASGRLLYAGGSRIWVVDPSRGRVVEAPEEAGPVLQMADRFRTLPEHRKALLQMGWQEDGSGTLDALLSSLVRSGALRSRDELLRRLLQSEPEAPPPPISAINWITRDRPALLRRSVESAIANLRRYGRKVELRVYDDSADAGVRRATREMLRELGRREGFAMFYAGAEEKHTFAAALQARSGTPPETIEFALLDPLGIGYAPGANMNAELLDTCGKLILHADDDTVFRLASLPEAEQGLRLSSALDPTEVRFHADAAEREAAVALHDEDILAAHESLLGRSLADCLRRHGGEADCREVSAEFLPALEAAGAGVAATMAGACGDSGMGSPLFVLWLSGRSRELALQSEEHYRNALRTREVLRAATQPTLSSGALLMSMHLGLDNRLLLPPFLPVLRNADGLFGQMLRASRPEGPIAHLPEAVLHLPGERRAFPGQRRLQPRLADLLLLLVRSLSPAPWLADPDQRLSVIAGGLVQAGRLKGPAFTALMRELWASEMSRRIAALAGLVEENDGRPRYWATEAETWLEQTRQQVTSPEPIFPTDLAAAGPEGLALAQRLLRSYGELALAWPSLRAASGVLCSSGVPLARLL
jgi:hypothetical protein